MKTKIFSVLLFLFLSSCANKMTLPGDYEVQLTPEKGKIEQLSDIKISYLVPNNMLGSEDIDGLVFSSRQWGESTKREKILTSYGDTNLQIERRTDNGVAGSGLIYSIDIDKSRKADGTIISFAPKTVKSYQDGLILPFPLPKFDLAPYLASASVLYKFEVVSNYPENSIKANFDRMLKSQGSGYEIQSRDFSAHIGIKIYPYRTGSKIIIQAKISNMKPVANLINVSNNIKELEKSINDIVNN